MHISSSRILATTALATVFGAQAALADVSSKEVWDNWKTYMTSAGYDVSANEAVSGDTLTVTGLTMDMELPESGGNVTMNWGVISFKENGDGTVLVTMPETTPVSMVSNSPSENFTVKMDMTSDLSTVASGTIEAVTYAYGSAETRFEVTELIIDGETVPDLELDVVFTGFAGNYDLTQGEMLSSGGTTTVDSVEMTLSAVDPDNGAPIDVVASLNGLAAEVVSSLPADGLTGNPMALFVPGMNLAGGYTFDAMRMTANFVEDGTPGEVSFESRAGSFNIDMDDQKLAYDGDLTDLVFKAYGSEIPVPIDVSFGEIGYGFKLPIAASEDAQDFAFNLKLADLKVSELLWGMFDPGQVLPRDPATLIVDLVGKGTVLMDLMTLDETTAEMPGELNALTIRDLRLNAAGASVEGSGDFVFDNTDLESFDGMPRPEGALDLTISGANGLMDKLTQMGLLPEEQAMGARMMMSMFTQPGAGDDTLTSKIEVNAQGHVSANGQRLK
ncbi:DUF2125 domain-containing protein [Shimia sp.]|uniref:DUF2125 domain-containing protein n=1 Tax=Shimia sp. TaxID=1954381 RepID=UPI003B8DF1FF